MTTNSITQEYLEKVRKEAIKSNGLVNIILERTLESAKRGDWASITYIHESEHTKDEMVSAYNTLKERQFKVELTSDESDNVNGYHGSIKIYLGLADKETIKTNANEEVAPEQDVEEYVKIINDIKDAFTVIGSLTGTDNSKLFKKLDDSLGSLF